LTVYIIRIYIAQMWWRIVSVLFLSIWLILLSVEFCEDLGLFDYDDPGMDQSMNATLASLGDGIHLSDYPQKAVFPPFALGILYPYLYHSLPLQSFREGARFIKASHKIFKIYEAFLI